MSENLIIDFNFEDLNPPINTLKLSVSTLRGSTNMHTSFLSTQNSDYTFESKIQKQVHYVHSIHVLSL